MFGILMILIRSSALIQLATFAPILPAVEFMEISISNIPHVYLSYKIKYKRQKINRKLYLFIYF